MTQIWPSAVTPPAQPHHEETEAVGRRDQRRRGRSPTSPPASPTTPARPGSRRALDRSDADGRQVDPALLDGLGPLGENARTLFRLPEQFDGQRRRSGGASRRCLPALQRQHDPLGRRPRPGRCPVRRSPWPPSPPGRYHPRVRAAVQSTQRTGKQSGRGSPPARPPPGSPPSRIRSIRWRSRASSPFSAAARTPGSELERPHVGLELGKVRTLHIAGETDRLAFFGAWSTSKTRVISAMPTSTPGCSAISGSAKPRRRRTT